MSKCLPVPVVLLMGSQAVTYVPPKGAFFTHRKGKMASLKTGDPNKRNYQLFLLLLIFTNTRLGSRGSWGFQY